MDKRTKAFLILLITPILWGVTFPLIRLEVAHYSPEIFVLWRFALSALILLPVFIITITKRKLKLSYIIYGLLIGIPNSGAFVLQAIALKELDSARTAFLSGSYVIMVPFLLPLFRMGKIKLIELLAAAICLIGIYILNDARFQGFSFADLLVLLSAVCIAISIIITEKASRHAQDLMLLTFYQLLFTAAIPLLMSHSQLSQIPSGNLFWWGLIYCAIFATVVPSFLQLKYQKDVGSNKIAIIFNLEAVTAAICAWFLGEHIGWNIVWGGVIIIISSVTHEIWQFMERINRSTKLLDK